MQVVSCIHLDTSMNERQLETKSFFKTSVSHALWVKTMADFSQPITTATGWFMLWSVFSQWICCVVSEVRMGLVSRFGNDLTYLYSTNSVLTGPA